MSISGLIIALLMLVALLVVTFSPLLRRPTRSGDALFTRERERALAYYERVLTNIRDLDEDHATGKIAASEYHTEREYWADRGVRVLKLLDELDANRHLVDNTEDDAVIDAAIEEAITAPQDTNQRQRTHEAS